ncbi:LpxL/LpxP family Kdo(2)-lipid IV(A) lauroyl/palmitoleoyl acyltransferase [Pseudomaricurvus alcaniphilus]|uniref:LpxL/LpxP family Kdo(2)-lipid IV(A) lauroyl/palmitoleoyl acyltransferase n=1 Tax=Pseudomaricurvus alcaniphilus TaxID=1166482 RepID=UPI0014087017|nr:LpxL/LpxP family Kdo(2)-lipid IV(A) lauroyl/palmitoleoyl acyltransferase [Pseudomaricurvus alcaniphilus]NHN38990.1 LpxL/LpxP family Kdo(2)-lipid IV(A) lauroyl/palmitoleoyl acyltransferase [Pseudomaricurvus alcaniphilus]
MSALRNYLGPKYWLTWLSLGCMWLLGQLSLRAQVRVGKLLGLVVFHLARRRRHIAEVNIDLCFPELSEDERAKLVRNTINENAIGLVETSSAWWKDPEYYRNKLEIEGQEHLQEALSHGRGVIMVGAHYTTLDLGGVLVSLIHQPTVMYRANRNPLFDLMMKTRRQRFCKRVIERRQMREVFAAMKAGDLMWYAPDQDYGRKQSVFAPFFGVPAATITATSRLTKINQSPLIILSHHRKADNSGYILSFSPVVEGFPSGNDLTDTTLINKLLEEQIRKNPAQYMWVHRRFKTRPEGEDKLY